MEIVPYYGDQQLELKRVRVRVNPEDGKRFRGLVEGSRSTILDVSNSAEYAVATQVAGQLKGISNEILKGKKLAGEQFQEVLLEIGKQAGQLLDMVEAEHKRVLALLNTYVAKLEAERTEIERQRQEELRQQQEEHDRKIWEAREALAKAELEARQARDEAARERARAQAKTKELAVVQEQLAKELDDELSLIGAEKRARGLVPGGRVDHLYEFRLLDIAETIRSGALVLLRWEVDHRACQDSCRRQLEIDANREPTLPGIQVTRKISVSVRAK
jgi:hypothetical protein